MGLRPEPVYLPRERRPCPVPRCSRCFNHSPRVCACVRQGYVSGGDAVSAPFPRASVEVIGDAEGEEGGTVRRRVFSFASSERITSIDVPSAERTLVGGELVSLYEIAVETNRRKEKLHKR